MAAGWVCCSKASKTNAEMGPLPGKMAYHPPFHRASDLLRGMVLTAFQQRLSPRKPL